MKPLDDSTTFRMTLNTLKHPVLVAFSVALGCTDGVLHDFPAGANVRAHGEGSEGPGTAGGEVRVAVRLRDANNPAVVRLRIGDAELVGATIEKEIEHALGAAVLPDHRGRFLSDEFGLA